MAALAHFLFDPSPSLAFKAETQLREGLMSPRLTRKRRCDLSLSRHAFRKKPQLLVDAHSCRRVLRKTLGVTPTLLRNVVVKCAWLGKPRDKLTSANESLPSTRRS